MFAVLSINERIYDKASVGFNKRDNLKTVSFYYIGGRHRTINAAPTTVNIKYLMILQDCIVCTVNCAMQRK